ncbi:MAG: outer membrane lipoprotein-sorting protein [Aestuariivita sp.]|nr:outer membrane lipoprotein-sorting protein [Aestuariivita sp.]MCY4345673.1 outer membrane lipoprotein-sorting protein [Aestuariivita sp.]
MANCSQQQLHFVISPIPIPRVVNELQHLKNKICVFLVFLAAALPFNTDKAYAQSATEKGLQVAKAARAAVSGFDGLTVELEMTLRNRQGNESRRALRLKTLESPSSGDKSIFVFDSPKDVAGTAFLVHSHKNKPDDQWLYLPALKRVKRIRSSNRSGSFMGSEFSYEDMTTPAVEKFKHTWLRDEACGNLTCAVIESVPIEKGSGYSRQVGWFDTASYRTWKTEYFDRRNKHLKTLTYSDYNRYGGKHWRAAKLSMVNHLTGKSSNLDWSNFDFGVKLSDRDFTQTSLRRIR